VIFEQVGGEGVAEGVAAHLLGHACRLGRGAHGLLQTTFGLVMTAHDAAAGVHRQPSRGEDVLPDPLPGGRGVFTLQGVGQIDDSKASDQVLFVQKGGYKVTDRHFIPQGLPLCAAGLPIPLLFTYTDHTVTLIEHERAKYVCPLQTKNAPADAACPINHKRWPKGGCTTTMPTSVGARLRYTLDRDSDVYKDAYRQRTATERINSQAVAPGIERPHLRNGQAVANRNTLIYTLINLRFLQRIRDRLASSN